MSALILLHLSIMHNFKYSIVKIFCDEYYQKALHEESVDIFLTYLHIKFHISFHNQLLLDVMTVPVYFR